MTFIEALNSQDLEKIRKFPKADLHNHFVLGGSREYIFNKTGYKIKSITTPLKSMGEMDSWSSKYIGNHFNSPEGRKLLIEATFAQAKFDGVTVLEIGEDVWGLGEFFDNDIEKMIELADDVLQQLMFNLSFYDLSTGKELPSNDVQNIEDDCYTKMLRIIHEKKSLNEIRYEKAQDNIERIKELHQCALGIFRNGSIQDTVCNDTNYYVDETVSDEYLLELLGVRIKDRRMMLAAQREFKEE